MNAKPFPQPTRINGRLYWSRVELEKYKHALLGTDLKTADRAVDEFVPAKMVAQEFGFGRRTLARRIGQVAV